MSRPLHRPHPNVHREEPIKLAQQLVIDPSNGLGGEDVGALVTLDRAARLLEEAIPTSWRSEIEQVADKYTPGSAESHIMQAVALCSDVPALTRGQAAVHDGDTSVVQAQRQGRGR